MLAVAEHQDIKNELVPRLATGFCSGLARTGGMCGAVTGGVMAIGLVMGRNAPGNDIDPSYQAVRTFLERFGERFKSLSCLELTGVHLGTPEGQAAFREKGQMKLCTEYVGEAARLVEEVTSSLSANIKDLRFVGDIQDILYGRIHDENARIL